MIKHISPAELAQIVADLLVRPQKVGELDTADAYTQFIEAIGTVVADSCGGEIQGVYAPGGGRQPMLMVAPNDSLPSLGNNVWSDFDPTAWSKQEHREPVEADAGGYSCARCSQPIDPAKALREGGSWVGFCCSHQDVLSVLN